MPKNTQTPVVLTSYGQIVTAIIDPRNTNLGNLGTLLLEAAKGGKK